ncbi:extracellular matrix-binding ebh, putative [Babesia caballi]|uniref:Extracellular matrix-binding ebh, putative n=1 Tax=Babesia caballi TaxID=5871 RepID=A0AAV4M1P0_BABCB|nr:extracellular matrix-binding ebh, putative [Babesia caballi]
MAPAIPFFYQLFMTNSDDFLPVTFFNLKGTDHNPRKPSQYNGTHNDLYSLFNSTCSEPKCGPYLYPLTHSDGATFAPTHASTYLSWVLYLTDDLYESLQAFHERFSSLKCTGCKNDSKCQPHNPGDHASQCTCPSIVDCADVLPLLYRDGFRFLSAFRLKGMKKESSEKGYTQTAETKRQCSAFATQLQSVISGNPLTKLLESIDDFLFLFRYYFLGNLSAFWTIYMCLILYTFFFLLDTLHLRSHLKLTSSHTVPHLALLTSGKPLPITKLTYIGQ